jgi:hypothetical protein
VLQKRVRQKKKGKFGGGQQPRRHPQVTSTYDRVARCPHCDGLFTIAIQEEEGAFKLKRAARYIGNVSMPTMRRLIDRGLVRPNRSLRHLTVPRAELDRFLMEGMSE